MSLLKKLAGQTALYGLSSMVGRAINFLLVPLFTAFLPEGQFGVFTELYAYVAFLNVVYLFGMETTYFRFSNKDKSQELEVYRSTQTFVFITTLLLSGALLVFASDWASLLKYQEKESYIVLLALIMGADAITALPFARLRQENRAGYFAFLKLTNIALNIGFTVFFIVVCKKIYLGEWMQSWAPFVLSFYSPSNDIEFVILANLLANAAMIPFLWKHFAQYRVRWSWEKFKPLFLYSYPLMFMQLAGMVNEVLDRILLKPFLPQGFYEGLTNEEALGIYGGCYKLSMFMTLTIQSFRYAADPFFFSRAEDKNAPELFAKVMNYFVLVCAGIFMLVSLFKGEIASLVLRKPSYAQGLDVVPLLLLANLFLGVYYNLSVWYKLTDKTYFGTFIAIGGALITIVFNIALIPVMGYMGAAWTTLVCYFLMAVVSYVLGNKYFPVPYSLAKILAYLALAIGLVYGVEQIPSSTSFVTLGLKMLALLVYCGLAFGVTKVVNPYSK